MASKNKAVSPEINELLSTPEAKGKRLRRARNMANLTREQLCEHGGINIHTLIGWENGRFGGLTRSGAVRLIGRLEQEGIQCSVEWLLYEIGPGPNLVNNISENQLDSDSSELEADQFIRNELALFRKQNQNAIDFVVADDSMMPLYNLGEYVAGKKRFAEKIECLIGMDCIVELEDGKIMLRNVRKSVVMGTYNLVCNNPHTIAKDAILKNIKLISAAPVIWHRKKDPS